MKSFLRAIEGIESDNEFVKSFQHEAEGIKENETWRESYMQSLLREMDRYDEAYENGLEAGQEVGAHNSKIEMARKSLKRGEVIRKLNQDS